MHGFISLKHNKSQNEISKLIFKELLVLSFVSLSLFILMLHLSGIVSVYHLLLSVVLLYVPFLGGIVIVVIVLIILISITYQKLRKSFMR